MLSALKNHPFAVDAYFDYSLVLTYAVPKEALQHLIPPCLNLDTYNDTWAFVAVALVKTRNLRPAYFPAFLGMDFFLTGYRIFVRYTTNTGKRLRGLYILKSETNRRNMEWIGSLFTRYQYTTTDITEEEQKTNLSVQSQLSGLNIRVDTNHETAQLPTDSPFPDWKIARRYAGPLPFTFSFDSTTREVLIVEGMREHWEPAPVTVLEAVVPFVQELNLPDAHLANAFLIRDISYHWKPGRTERWNG